MTRWQLPTEPNIPTELLDFTGDRLLAQLLLQRGLATVDQTRGFLDPAHYQPTPPDVLPDMEVAVARLSRAVERQELICVWGDFDVDGQTSTALLVSTLRDLGGQVRYYIPNRLTESHGLKIPALNRLLAEGINLILTCDTGIAEHEAIAAAHAAGTDVIVTDHHDLADSLPPARAVINPKRLPPDHPLRELPGVGVAYKLAQALYQAHDQAAASQQLLDLVALGIVADVAQQTGDTRYLLQQGLACLRQTGRIGLQALIESTNLKIDRLNEEHIGFWLAPRLNALGRLGDANLAVELLTTTDRTRARIIALQLEALNDRRKLLVDRVVVQAYDKPAILIALRPDGQGRGSARSVPGCDIHQALKTQADFLTGFGGHPMAAGLTITPPNVTAFRRGLSAALAGCRPSAEKTITLDLLVDLPQISATLLTTIQRLAPFGAGNPPVRLGCPGLKVVGEAPFGKTRVHKRLVVEDKAGHQQEVIRWGGAAERSPQGTFDLAFTLSPDDFKGGGAVQLVWVAAQEWAPTPVTRPPEFIDWRQVPNPQTEVQHLISNPQSPISNLQSPISNLQSPISNPPLIWAEGVTLPALTPLPRHKLHAAESLVIWTAPPGQDILQQVLVTVRPQQIFLVGQPSPVDTFPAFIKRLMGLVKYSMTHKEGEIYLEELAAGLGHRLTTARLGLDWLVAQGKLAIAVEEEEVLVLRPEQQLPTEAVATIENILESTLAETAAYRRFFKEASLASLKNIGQSHKRD
jgi:single-stranded-DNA-specific exonuclease